MLQKAGFTLLPKRGKGSHSYWLHPLLDEPIILSGKDGSDARFYQEKAVKQALKAIQRLQGDN